VTDRRHGSVPGLWWLRLLTSVDDPSPPAKLPHR
jgi:hypothetical protein